MLKLTRRPRESIYIGDYIETIVLESTDKRVLLGINAPKDVPVHRHEVLRRIRCEKKRC